MPYRYFGRTNQFFGRPLWEILMNLKNFGKGRLVTRSSTVKECPNIPSFYKIVSVHPHILDYPEDFRGNIYVEEVYRGRKRAEVIDIGRVAGFADFELIHKDKEGEIYRKVEAFLANPENHKPIVRPRTTPLPPVWRLIIAREKNIPYKDVPEIPIVYEDLDPEIHPPTRLANEGEQPDFRIGPGHFSEIHPEFYEHVTVNREAAKEKYSAEGPQLDFVYANKTIPPLFLEKEIKENKYPVTFASRY